MSCLHDRRHDEADRHTLTWWSCEEGRHCRLQSHFHFHLRCHASGEGQLVTTQMSSRRPLMRNPPEHDIPQQTIRPLTFNTFTVSPEVRYRQMQAGTSHSGNILLDVVAVKRHEALPLSLSTGSTRMVDISKIQPLALQTRAGSAPSFGTFTTAKRTQNRRHNANRLASFLSIANVQGMAKAYAPDMLTVGWTSAQWTSVAMHEVCAISSRITKSIFVRRAMCVDEPLQPKALPASVKQQGKAPCSSLSLLYRVEHKFPTGMVRTRDFRCQEPHSDDTSTRHSLRDFNC